MTVPNYENKNECVGRAPCPLEALGNALPCLSSLPVGCGHSLFPAFT